jgi:hypothetical protein
MNICLRCRAGRPKIWGWGLLMRLPSIILSLLAATLVTAVPARAQQGLTNGDIIKMQSAGLSENIILASVNGQPAAYDTSTPMRWSPR